MPIVRTYACPECNHRMDVTLTMEQVDNPPPICPRCTAYDFEHQMHQEFKPVAITGSNSARAHAVAEDIISNDYQVAHMEREHRPQGTPKVRYKDQSPQTSSVWGATSETLNAAIAAGRQSRLKYGNGLDVLQSNLKSGVQPDLIELSKRRSPKVW